MTFPTVSVVLPVYNGENFIRQALESVLSQDFKDYEITDKFLKLVEKQIHEAPEYYLWTHKRWKHREL